ncbi:hypothetical protein PO654_26190 [Phytobacter diazotrophicus]|uniref:G domain-containing protein n=2 Tax=Enterobacteriaceae TaxID=543 RepID=A0AAC8QVD0_9ENTR|nr:MULTISPECIES: hypothetical protein [Phytobacter]AUV02969.1 hypothetical protein C2U51_19270 [Enterobacteriaceae bacterium ENNIH1]MBS6741032.1 hypothetical protein [Enterobacteriaceae bacterium]QIH65584.1 hypothetical protein CRX67_22295 [Enterobacteriaceae bacterium A-F18]HAT2206883.1 hypothetical protein [Kluyvera intermedia]AKL15177.1 hypothetical protein AB182_29605 [Phytobacter ursingii]
MSVDVETPHLLYQKISLEVGRIISNLTENTTNEKLQETNEDARGKLEAFRKALDANIESLKRNAEWDRFTIAFYGETNAGKSTVIETLRILLKEESKQQRQKAFREFQHHHQLNDSDIEKLQQSLDDNQKNASELTQAIEAINSQYIERETTLQQQINALSALILAQQQLSSIWQKLLNLWRKTPEQKEHSYLLVKQRALDIEKAAELKELENQKTDCDAQTAELQQLQAAQQAKFAELAKLADGEIIGTGVSDFTMDTTLYPFEANQQRFALLDVPGIEGKESKVLAQIQQAVEKAHAVFYVTSKATAPQKGDENNPGTLEKIKSHLNAQTEVWTLFNKRITNPMQLNRPTLLSPDEEHSLEDLNEKMREQLGDNYCDTWTVSAMPAFLSVAEHLVPGSENLKKQSKLLESLGKDVVLDKTGLTGFLNLLTQKLVANSKEKITHSNINKARKTVEDATVEITRLQKETYGKLSKQLDDEMQNAHQLLDISLASLKSRLSNQGEEAVEKFKNKTRRHVYAEIDSDISNDRFKSTLENCLTRQHAELEKELPGLLKRELDIFKDETEDIVRRFQQYAKEILATYSRLQQHKFDGQFDVKIDIDNGIKLTSLLATFVGGALLFWNPAGWIVLAPALAGLVFAFYKAVRSFFSSSYKMSQQRQSADENLNKVARSINESISEGLTSAFPELEEKVEQLKAMLREPVRQASHTNEILKDASQKLQQLSESIGISGAK